MRLARRVGGDGGFEANGGDPTWRSMGISEEGPTREPGIWWGTPRGNLVGNGPGADPNDPNQYVRPNGIAHY